MGIPSFYRHLCRRFPNLITKGVGPAPEWLCLDFNCAMYHVLHKMPPFSDDHKRKWEADYCSAIAAYMEEVITLAKPTKGVYVSCDGAVCAAKRRQQRLRRFKGPWIAAMEAQVQGKSLPTKWDQNALTPGSMFMAQLGGTLIDAGRALQKKFNVPITVSTTAEWGEGEHKLLAHMRRVRPVSCTIYGLDADLILLSMLLGADTGADVRLMREAQEFEGTPKDGSWRSLTIAGLTDAMIPAASNEKIRDFVAAMTFLGNDFLPRSLTRTVRDDGIPNLIATLQQEVWGAGLSITDEAGLRRDGLLAITKAWATTEERDLIVAANAAQKASRFTIRSAATPEETALKEWNALPSKWASIVGILNPKNANALNDRWRYIYKAWHAGAPADYVKGLAWTWDYYSGKSVDQGWFFDEHLPPLWSDVYAYLSATSQAIAAPPVQYPAPLPDWLHLLSVLPADSVEKLLPPKAQRLMAKVPWYWPTSWSVYDVGKSQMWECEPVIPIIPEVVLREYLSTFSKVDSLL